MVDKSVSGLFLTLIIDSIIFVIVMILYLALRKQNSTPLMQTYPSYMKTSYINDQEYSLKHLFGKILGTKDEEIKQNLGKPHVFYLGFLKTIYWIVLIVGFVGMAILIPVYAVGDNAVKTEMDLIGIGHVNGNGELLAPSVILLVFFSGVLDFFICKYAKKCLSGGLDTEPREYKAHNISLFTLWVWGLPRDKSAASLQTDFEHTVSAYDSDESIKLAYVIPNYSKSYQHLLQIQEFQTQLNYCKRSEKVHNERPTKKGLSSSAVDLITHYEQLILQTDQKLTAELTQADSTSTGMAFLVFSSIPAKLDFEKRFSGKDDNLNSKQWKFHDAPAPLELKWGNLSINQKVMPYVRVIMTIVFAILFLVLLTPSFFLKFIGEILGDIGIGAFAEGFLNQYLATILMIVYMSVVLPFFIRLFVKYEKYPTAAEEEISTFEKFSIFFVFYMFIVPSIGLSFMNLIIQFITGKPSFSSTLTEGTTTAGQFLLMFMIHQTMISLPLKLLNPGRLIVRRLKEKLALDEEERLKAWDYDEFQWAYEYAVCYTLFVIVVCMSVVYPLILSFGILYFMFRYIVHKHWLLCATNGPKDSERELHVSVMKASIFVVFLFQFLTSLVLLIADHVVIIAFGAALAAISLIGYIASMIYIKKLIAKRKKRIHEEQRDIVFNEWKDTFDPKVYIHPIQSKLEVVLDFSDLEGKNGEFDQVHKKKKSRSKKANKVDGSGPQDGETS